MFGFGIVTMFDLIWLLIKIYFVAALLSFVMMYINSTGDGFLKYNSLGTKLAKLSLGNLGFNEAYCVFLPLL